MPLVSIICLCHNHQRFIEACLESILTQSYNEIEMVIVDDGSSDQSKRLISQTISNWSRENQERTEFVNLDDNIGNCRAFNQGLARCSGKYVIDLAGDDLLEPIRVAEQVHYFETLDDSFGVIYSDAEYIDEQSQSIGLHRVPQPVIGSVYSEVVSRYFIPPPTMMIRRHVLDEMGGYDEALAYEDFDFWVRSARTWNYGYIAKPLTKIRKVRGSLSTKFYERGSPLADSTYKVCEKILALNQTKEEHQALAKRIRYERRQCALLGNRPIATKYGELLKNIAHLSMADRLLGVFIHLGMDWSWLLRWRHRLRRTNSR